MAAARVLLSMCSASRSVSSGPLTALKHLDGLFIVWGVTLSEVGLARRWVKGLLCLGVPLEWYVVENHFYILP
jgi:hypothetical protein